jgi:DNA-binding MarR family transcriptional regulator
VDKFSARGGNAKAIVIKRLIEINEPLFEGLGLRFGDGIKLQGGENRIFGFSNTCLELVKYFLKFANECFDINSSQFKVALTIPPELKSSIEEVKEKISRELNIPKENFFNTRLLEQTNSVVVNITISSRLLAMIVFWLYENLKEILLSEERYCAAMLRGIIASEGNISLAYNSQRLGDITIGAKEKTERDFIRQLLSKLQIIPDRDKEIRGQECVLITGLSNFKIMDKWNLCQLQPEKQKDFKIGMSNFKVEQSRKGELRLKVLQLLAEKARARQELAKILNRSPATVKTEALYILENQGLVKRGELNFRSRIWEITEKGLEILKDEKVLEKLRFR